MRPSAPSLDPLRRLAGQLVSPPFSRVCGSAKSLQAQMIWEWVRFGGQVKIIKLLQVSLASGSPRAASTLCCSLLWCPMGALWPRHPPAPLPPEPGLGSLPPQAPREAARPPGPPKLQ